MEIETKIVRKLNAQTSNYRGLSYRVDFGGPSFVVFVDHIVRVCVESRGRLLQQLSGFLSVNQYEFLN